MVRYGKYLCLFAVFITVSLTSTVSAEFREFEFRITDHQAGIEDFRKLDVQLASVSIHPMSAARNDGWIELDSEFAFVDIVPLKNGRYVSSGTYQVPSARYDAIRVRFQSVVGELQNEMPPKISAKDTTVAVNLDLSGNNSINGKLALVLDLYVESQTDHEPNLYVVKVKEIRVER